MTKSLTLTSVPYIPANSWRMIVNGLAGMQDTVILDLGGAVPAGGKGTGKNFRPGFYTHV